MHVGGGVGHLKLQFKDQPWPLEWCPEDCNTFCIIIKLKRKLYVTIFWTVSTPWLKSHWYTDFYYTGWLRLLQVKSTKAVFLQVQFSSTACWKFESMGSQGLGLWGRNAKEQWLVCCQRKCAACAAVPVNTTQAAVTENPVSKRSLQTLQLRSCANK